MSTRSKSTLFLTEQLVVIAVFALCAVACISILTASYYMATDANDTAEAMNAAQTLAEHFKAFGGADYFYPQHTIYYNKDWRIVAYESDAEFTLTLTADVLEHPDGSAYYGGTVVVSRADGMTLVELPVAIISNY